MYYIYITALPLFYLCPTILPLKFRLLFICYCYIHIHKYVFIHM